MQTKNESSRWDYSLEQFLGSLQDGVIVLDANQQIVHINPAGREIFGLGDGDCFGRSLTDVIEQPEIQSLVSLLDEATVQHNRTDIPVGEDGYYSGSAVQLDDGSIAITLHEISHWKKHDRIKSDFISTVSHDLRSPLTSIMGYVELIERVGPVTEQQRGFIKRVQTNAANIARLLEDLVKLGRFETGYDTSRERLVVPEIVADAAKGLSKEIEKKDICLDVNFGESFPNILGNRGQIQQMFTCLLDNMVKFSPAESRVRVAGEQAGEQIIVKLSDAGIGIPEQELIYIYDRFYRGSNVGDAEPGNGLGLAIVKTVVENHEGRIWIDSSLDSGTQVTVVLPALGS